MGRHPNNRADHSSSSGAAALGGCGLTSQGVHCGHGVAIYLKRKAKILILIKANQSPSSKEALMASPAPTVTAIPITKARINLGTLVKRAHLNKECFILEKDGIPIAGLMDIDDFEDWLELQDPKIREQIRKSHQEYLSGKSRPAEILLAEIKGRKSRGARRRPKT